MSAPLPILINPSVSADRDRYNQVIERLRGRLREGDQEVERVFWTMSRGTRFMAIDVGRTLVKAWSVD